MTTTDGKILSWWSLHSSGEFTHSLLLCATNIYYTQYTFLSKHRQVLPTTPSAFFSITEVQVAATLSRLKQKQKQKNLMGCLQCAGYWWGAGATRGALDTSSSLFSGSPLVSTAEGPGHNPEMNSSSRRSEIHQFFFKPANRFQEGGPALEESGGFCGQQVVATF